MLMLSGLSSVCVVKQKTAYEMRISDWSSDVCSSDLVGQRRGLQRADRGAVGDLMYRRRMDAPAQGQGDGNHRDRGDGGQAPGQVGLRPARSRREHQRPGVQGGSFATGERATGRRRPRSEEHTSELQSLMRISYDVFCLKKQKHEINK